MLQEMDWCSDIQALSLLSVPKKFSKGSWLKVQNDIEFNPFSNKVFVMP